jgi:hypothetical protein
MSAVAALATDGNNPMSPYIHDLIENPTKYCGCNTAFGNDLPDCEVPASFSPTGEAIDLGKFKQLSCYFTELCDELESTCDVIIQAEDTCMSNSGMANPGSAIDCQFDCASTIEVPEPCWKSDHATDEFTEKFNQYQAACPSDTPAPDNNDDMIPDIDDIPDVDDIPDIDFDDFAQCLSIYDGVDTDALTTCNLDMSLGSAIVKFMSCTDWAIGDIVGDFSGASFVQFESVISECSDTSDEGMKNCFDALKDASEENDNPLSVYLGDLYGNPAKYCGCNKKLYANLPAPCMFNLPGDNVDFDLGQVKLSSCLIGELCEEIEEACHSLGDQLDGCLPKIEGIKKDTCGAIVDGCVGMSVDEDMVSGAGIPPGCFSEFDRNVRRRVKEYQSICLGLEPTGEGDGKDEGGDGGIPPGGAPRTTSSFPPAVAVGIAVVLFAGLGYVVFRKMTMKRKYPQMQISFDDDEGGMNMDGSGMHAGGITLSNLHMGKTKKGGFAQLGDDDGEDDDKDGNNFADFQSQLGQTFGGVRRPSEAAAAAGGNGSGNHAPAATAFSIGDDDDIGFDLQVTKSDDVEVSL